MWKHLPSRRVLKTLRENPKRTISASGGFGLLQMESEPNTGRCAYKDAEPQRGWIVRSHLGWRGKRSILYKGVETSPEQTRFKDLEGKSRKKNLKRIISARGEFRDWKYLLGRHKGHDDHE